MNSVKILHTADCHLGCGRVSASNGKAELKNTFFRILNLCNEEKIDFLLIAGDLFDSAFTDRETVIEITNALSHVPDTHIIIVSGNHDCACPDSVYDTFPFPENVHLFTSDMECCDFPDKNTRIYAAGFSSPHLPYSRLAGFTADKTDMICIGVLHGELTVAGEGSVYNPISIQQIAASQLDYLALGHIHKRSEIMKSGGTFYAYCGCPDGRGFDETGDKGVYIGTVFKGGCSLSYHMLSSRLYANECIDISGCTSSHLASETILQHIKNKYTNSFSENLYRITLTGNISPDIVLNVAQIQNEVEQSIFYCEIYDQTFPELCDLFNVASEQTLRGIFIRNMLDRLANTTPDEQQIIHNALKIGLRAFEREVTLLDN